MQTLEDLQGSLEEQMEMTKTSPDTMLLNTPAPLVPEGDNVGQEPLQYPGDLPDPVLCDLGLMGLCKRMRTND